MTTRQTTTVGILYPGEMGCALASLLRSRGTSVVTTLHHRTGRTARRCADAGISVLPTLADVVRQADVMVSLVPPSAAEEVAADYCALARLAPPSGIFVDANSVAPDVAAALAARVEATGHSFVDAAVNGLAANLAAGGTLYLSGGRAGDVARLFGDAMRVRVLGDVPGRASAMKMLLAGISKGLCALFVELALVARRQDLLPEMLEAAGQIYPGITTVIERMLPTYARHAARRAAEMGELGRTVSAAGIEPCVTEAIRRLHEAMAAGCFIESTPADPSVTSLIEHLAACGLLSAEPVTSGPS